LSTTEIIVNEVSLDTFKGEGFPVKITKQINDLRKLKTRNASFTSQISFPRTAKNTGALSGLTPTFKNSKVTPTSLSCVILMNGVTVLSGGRFTLSSKGEDRYKGTVFFGNFDFFNLLEGDISELQWGIYDQSWTRPFIESKISDTTTGIVFALAAWFRPFGVQSLPAGSMWNADHEINFSGFHAYTRTILTNIVQELGFTYDDSAITDSLWDELAIACPVTAFAQPVSGVGDPIFAEWDKTSTQSESDLTFPGTSFRITFDTLVTDADTLFDNATDQYDIDRTARILIEIKNCAGNWRERSGPAHFVRFNIMKNGFIILKTFDVPEGDFDFSFSVVTNVISGDFIWLRIDVSGARAEINTATIIIQDADGLASHTADLIIGDWIPKIDKKDFLRWIFALFNVQIEADSRNKTVTLKPFDAVLTASEQDWSKNLDISKVVDEGITLPYAQNNKFEYAEDEKLVRSDSNGNYTIVNPVLRKELVLVKLGFGASDGAQRKGIYIRGTAVAEYPVYIMRSQRLTGMNTTAGLKSFTIDSEGSDFQVSDYIEVGGNIRQIDSRSSDTAGTVSIVFTTNNASQDWTSRKFEIQDLIPPRIARIVASQGDYKLKEGNEGSWTTVSGGLEAVFTDDLLWNSIIANSYQNLLDNVANPLIIKGRFRFEVSEFVSIDMLKPVYLDQYSSLFYINKIMQYRSDGFCFVELIRIN